MRRYNRSLHLVGIDIADGANVNPSQSAHFNKAFSGAMDILAMTEH